MDFYELGAALKQARKSKKFSQDEVALATGVGRSTLSRIENGAIEEIGIRKIIRICEFLGVCLEVVPESRPPTLAELVRERQLSKADKRKP